MRVLRVHFSLALYPPRLCAVFLVVTGSIIHDVRPVLRRRAALLARLRAVAFSLIAFPEPHGRNRTLISSDGAKGIQAIKWAGGVTFVQDKNSARFFGMPSAAIQTDCVDFILVPGEIAQKLIRISGHHGLRDKTN
jgi:CheB methylesterase